LEVPLVVGEGEGREVKVLYEDGGLKLAAITLRRGTALPEHTAPVPVSIHAVVGGGVLVSGGERLALEVGRVVVLPAGAPHAVEPRAGEDMVILVHYLK
jgi:quercetin dioxygenase-like cupin family protein